MMVFYEVDGLLLILHLSYYHYRRRIFILGPSHHVPLSRCALSSVDIYRTPLYDLRIDQKGNCIIQYTTFTVQKQY